MLLAPGPSGRKAGAGAGRDGIGGASAVVDAAIVGLIDGARGAPETRRAADLGIHFETTVRTGTCCTDAPAPRRPVTWSV